MKMKTGMTMLGLVAGLMATAAQASARDCSEEAQAAAVAANKRMHGAESGECGARLLHRGDQKETWLVCVSDETDPSEWVVVTRNGSKAAHEARCSIAYAGNVYDSTTPDFE